MLFDIFCIVSFKARCTWSAVNSIFSKPHWTVKIRMFIIGDTYVIMCVACILHVRQRVQVGLYSALYIIIVLWASGYKSKNGGTDDGWICTVSFLVSYMFWSIHITCDGCSWLVDASFCVYILPAVLHLCIYRFQLRSHRRKNRLLLCNQEAF